MRTLAYTAAKRSALSADTRMPLDVRTVTGSNQKSPDGDRSSDDAIQRERKLNIPIAHASSRIGKCATSASTLAGLLVPTTTLMA
ncbi:MAG: hypothetical protein FAZ92_01686 [Accumulibacter sp.]|nr:MAG: hypothetical protein FAZ92_01686 [Accumulibacter sp.]